MTLVSRALTAVVFAWLLPACGGDDDGRPPKSGMDILDPAEEHYGKSYEEWAAAYVQWINSVAPPECAYPVLDTTGESCAMYQDPDSPVFFLAGNFGGVSFRDACVVPAGRAIFLPIVNAMGDNAGVPEDMLLPDSELRAYVESLFDHVDTNSLHLSVDGHAIGDLERGAVRSAPYTIHLAPGANVYDCQKIEGVEGDFSGYVSGYWALLAPLAAGAHRIVFGASADDALQGQPITIDVTFDLTVE